MVVIMETRINELKEVQKKLYEQLDQKDKQLDRFQTLLDQQQRLTLQTNKQIEQLQKLLEQQQILLLNEQKEKQLLLDKIPEPKVSFWNKFNFFKK